MAILDCKKTADHISGWIRDYARNAGVKTLVLGLSGGIDSGLVALLCKRSGLPLVCVNMPCRSSGSAFERAREFAKEYDIPLFHVNLSDAHNIITYQVRKQVDSVATSVALDIDSNGSLGGLSSCLRAPTLSFFAHATNGLIMGTGNRSEDHLTRYFQKFGDGCVDISPIADLFKSEVRELFHFLATNENTGLPGLGALAILDAKPTADLWGPDAGQEDEKELGISYDEIEWADRENMRTSLNCDDDSAGIVSSNVDPVKHESGAWLGYTARQQTVIARMNHLEKVSRHKANASLPVCQVRNVPGLVR